MKKIKVGVIQAFSGCGMQMSGIENTDCFEPENVATIENDINAIIAYAAIHEGLTPELIESYPDYPSRQEMIDTLVKKNIGYDFLKNKPYNWQRYLNSADSKNFLKTVWLADKLSKNLGDITKIDSIPHCGLLTWSFPCSDLSVSGQQRGMDAGETRSGLAWEVLRILHNTEDRPNFLLMENVDALVSKKFLPSYEALNEEFKKLGYDVKWQVINGKYCGVPQNRRRVFGVYWLRDKIDFSSFEFPKPFWDGTTLQDVLEDDVDEKYYITSDKARQLIEQLVVTDTVTEEDFDKKK